MTICRCFYTTAEQELRAAVRDINSITGLNFAVNSGDAQTRCRRHEQSRAMERYATLATDFEGNVVLVEGPEQESGLDFKLWTQNLMYSERRCS